MLASTLQRTGVATIGAALAMAPATNAQALRLSFDGKPGQLAGYVTELDDLDRDGAADFAIGAPNELNASGTRGTVRIYSGRSGSLLHEILGRPTSHAFGQAVADAGDVDGDGVGDIVIGDPQDDQLGSGGGAYYVYSGATGSIYYSGAAAALGYCNSVSGFADVDGDGKGDVALAWEGNDVVLVRAGNNGSYYTFNGQPGGLIGHDVSAAGDVDRDGVGDLIVGEPLFDGPGKGQADIGRALVCSGKTGLVLWDLRGTDPAGRFGVSVDGVGDVDGDGFADLIVGAYLDDGNGVDAGKAVVFSGKSGLAIHSLHGGAGTLFGNAVGGVGDMDRDGVPDFGVAAALYNSVGRVTTYSGATGLPFHDYDHACCFVEGEYWGFVTGADFDGDGSSDLAMSTPMYVDQVDQAGRVEIYCTAVASWSNYGTGWPGTLGVPAILAQQDPVIGGTIDVDIYDSTGAGTWGLLFVGLDAASVPTTKGGTLLVDPLVSLFLKIPPPFLTIADSIPDDPALCNVEYFFQAIEVDVGASKRVSFTPGLKLHLGYAY